LPNSLAGPAVLRRAFAGETANTANGMSNCTMLSLEDIHLGFPAQFDASHPVHQALARLNTGDRLQMGPVGNAGVGLHDGSGLCIARLSRKGAATWIPRLPAVQDLRVVAMLRRTTDQSEKEFQERCRVPEWDLPVAEVVLQDGDAG
jgi:ATP-dependent DNA helicase RecQ